VVEDVESFKPQFEVETFPEINPLNERRIDVPIARTVNRSQAQIANVPASGFVKAVAAARPSAAIKVGLTNNGSPVVGL